MNILKVAVKASKLILLVFAAAMTILILAIIGVFVVMLVAELGKVAVNSEVAIGLRLLALLLDAVIMLLIAIGAVDWLDKL